MAVCKLISSLGSLSRMLDKLAKEILGFQKITRRVVQESMDFEQVLLLSIIILII